MSILYYQPQSEIRKPKSSQLEQKMDSIDLFAQTRLPSAEGALLLNSVRPYHEDYQSLVTHFLIGYYIAKENETEGLLGECRTYVTPENIQLLYRELEAINAAIEAGYSAWTAIMYTV